MRFLGVGDCNSLGDMYWRLGQAGHEVRVCVREAEAHGIYRGTLARTADWRAELDWIRAAGADGIVIFETATMGAAADELRRDGFHVVGGSAFGDRLENDRGFGQQVMRDAGMQTVPTHAFENFDDGIEFVRERPGRYVFKIDDDASASTRDYVGMMDHGQDLVAVLQREQARHGAEQPVAFVLVQHVAGIEVGIGAYFDGASFLQPACIEWEQKRFFQDDLGELTGEMGAVVSYRGSLGLFEHTLARIAEPLRAARHCGYVSVNTIVDERGIWPLAFTCRFGYPGFAIRDALQVDGWGALFRQMTTRSAPQFATRDGFAVGVIVTVPPFPYEYGYAELSRGAPILFRERLTAEDCRHFHHAEVEWIDGRLLTSGSFGNVTVVTGAGDDLASARADAYARVGKIVVPNMRYRTDIGVRLEREDLGRLAALGYWH
jgi:phosphoribosylamine--glycine ligase